MELNIVSVPTSHGGRGRELNRNRQKESKRETDRETERWIESEREEVRLKLTLEHACHMTVEHVFTQLS